MYMYRHTDNFVITTINNVYAHWMVYKGGKLQLYNCYIYVCVCIYILGMGHDFWIFEYSI